MSLRPRALPKVRDQVVQHLYDPAAPVRSRTGAENQAGLDLAASHLGAAGLYWVSADMAALAVSAGASLETARWTTADRPAACGLIVFDGGIGSLDARGVEIPVEACTWGPAPDGCLIGLWISRWRVNDRISAMGAELVADRVPPLMPIVSFAVPVTSEPVPMAELPGKAPVAAIAALAASWLLMQQPSLSEHRVERPDKSVRRAYGRAGREDPDVTIVDLRRQYVPQREPEEGTEAGRRYRHRWVVSGHWRNAWRPSVREHRRVWIPSYVKGPDGAPLLVPEKVNVWRR